MNKKIIVSMFAIVAVATIAAVGSSAYWVDTARVGGEVKSGSMDLQTWRDGGWKQDGGNVLTLDKAFPGIKGEKVIAIKNDSDSVDGKLTVSLSDIIDMENGFAAPERVADVDNTDSGSGDYLKGELCAHVKIKWTLRKEHETTAIATTNSKPVRENTVWNFGKNAEMLKNITYRLTAEYEVDSAAGNNIMTDKCIFNAVATLTQNGGVLPVPTNPIN